MLKMDTKLKMNDSSLGLAEWSLTSDMYVYHLLYKLVNPVFGADSFCGFSSMFKPNKQFKLAVMSRHQRFDYRRWCC